MNSTMELNTEKEILKCSICNKEVKRDQDKLIKSCEHEKAIVVTEMKGLMKGKGFLK